MNTDRYLKALDWFKDQSRKENRPVTVTDVTDGGFGIEVQTTHPDGWVGSTRLFVAVTAWELEFSGKWPEIHVVVNRWSSIWDKDSNYVQEHYTLLDVMKNEQYIINDKLTISVVVSW